METKQSNIITKNLSWEEKVKFCNTWKESGISKSEFARRNRLCNSVFCGWCTKLWPKELKAATKTKSPRVTNDWMQIGPSILNPAPDRQSNLTPIEIRFPNGLVITMQV